MAGRSVSDRDFRWFLTGQMTSVFGSTLTTTAVSVIAVAEMGARPADVSMITAAGMVPALLIGPVAGVLLDRVSKPRRVLIAADLTAALAVGACAVAGFVGVLTVAGLACLSAVLGLVSIAMEGLYFSHLNGLGVANPGAARGRLQSTEMLSKSAAASIAGPTAALISAPLLLLGDAVTFVVSAFCLRRLRTPDRRPGVEKRERPNIGRELLDGISVVRTHSILGALFLYLALSGVAESGIAVVRAVFLLRELELPVALYTIPSVGALLLGAAGAITAPRLLARGVTPTRLILAGLPATWLATALLPAAGGPAVLVFAAAVAGIGIPVFIGALTNIALVTMVNDDIGDAYFGRVSTLLGSLATVAGLVGALLGGALGNQFGARTVIWLGIALGVLASALLLAAARTRSRSAPDSQPDLALTH